MSNIDYGFTCDSCGRKVYGVTNVNGMNFCAKCYQETFGNNYQQKDIINAQYTEHILKENAQLKQKIEELEQQLEKKSSYLESVVEADKVNYANYKEQLSEKDKEIEEYKQVLETYKKKPVNVYQMEIRNLQVDKAELKLELEEKIKIIYELNQVCQQYKMASPTLEDFENVQKAIRKQVCDEIKQAFNKEDFWLYGDNHKIISIHEDEFNEILDQIEQGEQK